LRRGHSIYMLSFIEINEGRIDVIAFLYQQFFVKLKLALKLDFFFKSPTEEGNTH